MSYQFSIGWFFIGLIILAIGVAFIRWYQWLADNLASGVSSYDHFRLYALITCIVGLIVMVNLHTLLLRSFLGLLFPGI
jgi:hypothetical protein